MKGFLNPPKGPFIFATKGRNSNMIGGLLLPCLALNSLWTTTTTQKQKQEIKRKGQNRENLSSGGHKNIILWPIENIGQ